MQKVIESIVICGIFTFLSSKIPAPSDGIISNVFFVAIISHFGFLLLGVLSFILRFSHFISRHTFFYVFMGVSNTWLGLLEITLYFIGKVNSGALEVAFPNLLIGLILIGDELRSSQKTEANRD